MIAIKPTTIYLPKNPTVFILEDNPERIKWFSAQINRIIPSSAVFEDDPDRAIRYFQTRDPESIDAVFLDFDLGHQTNNDPYHPTLTQITAAPLVEWLAEHVPNVSVWSRRVVIHSLNEYAPAWIRAQLHGATKVPFGNFEIKEKVTESN